MPQTPVIFPATLELSTLDGIIGTTFNGVSSSDYSGYSVASAGDINGDDLSDLIIGAPNASPGGQAAAGSSFVMFGTRSGFGAVLQLSTLNGTNGFRINGVLAGDCSGYSVASAGDINGDGLSDLIIGAYQASPGGRTQAGSSFVVFGTRSGFGAILELSTLDGTNGFRINGVSLGDRSGQSVSGAGDINGDGLSDLIIGENYASPGGRTQAGSSFVVFGKNTSFVPVLELSTLNGTNGFSINGVSAIDYSGWSVASAGDVNGDDLSDLIIGAFNAAPDGRTRAGSSFVVFGTRSGFGAALELSSLNGVNGFRINGVAAGDVSGVCVASGGDINGDGLSDLIVGAPYASPGSRSYAGSSFVVFGKHSGFNPVVELSFLNGVDGFRINGVLANDLSGSFVASAGDINGDGLGDLIIGSNAAPGGRSNAGSSFVVFGTRAVFGATLELFMLNGANGFRVNGVLADSMSGVVASAGDINGDGLGDLIIGASRASNGPFGGVQAGSSYLVFGDSIQVEVNDLTTSAGESQTLTPSSLNASVFRSPEYTQYTVTGLEHGQFEYRSQPGIAITHFSNEDIVAGRVNFTHDDSELAPSYSVTASHTLATMTEFANITFINQLPILINNSLTINQGQTVQLDNIMLAAVDPDNAQHNPGIVFTILSSSNGFFSAFSFSQSQLWNGGVYFTQDNTIFAPHYTVSISRGGVTIGPAYPVIDFDTAPVLQGNRFDICQGQTKLLTSQMLSAIQPGNFSSKPLIFSIQNLQYSRFERTNGAGVGTSNFSQAEVQNGSIQFVQDGSSNPPNFMFSVTDNRIMTPSYFAGIYFTYAPILRTNTLTLNQGQTLILNENMLNAFNPNPDSEDLVFTVSNVKQGNFIKVNTTQNISQFNQSQLTANQIAFKSDGGPVQPSYYVSVQNQCSKTDPTAVFVNFNSAPVLTANQLTVTNGKPVILTSTELSANDRETPLVDLGFTITGIQHGYFDTITLPGTPITVFSQQMVLNGAIRFVPENNFLLPAYNVSVSDGILWDGPEAALVRLNASSTIESSDAVRNAIIGGTVSGLISLGFLALRCYLAKRMNGALKNILVVENSSVEQEQEEWKRETLSPVVKEVFNRFKTTGLIGYRNEANTKAYVQGVELLLLEIEKQGAEVHFPKLSITERIRLLSAIVDEIKIQLVKPSGVGGFIKPAFTADDLKIAVPAIAKVVAMTINKEKTVDIIRRSVVERAKSEYSAHAVMVRDNGGELQEVDREQKFVSEAANQGLINQSSFETRMTAIEGHFAKFEERFTGTEENSQMRFTKIESSLEELLGCQSEANSSRKPKMSLVK